MLRMTRAATLFASTLLVISGCGPGAGASTEPSAAASTEPSTAASTEPSAEPRASEGGAASAVNMTDDATLGAYMTGKDGKTLYVFKNDSADTSTCSGDCAANWPPFVIDAGETAVGGAGVTGAFGTITRDDGTIQVTYDHQPLYYYSGDAVAGDTNGQNMFNAWVVAPVSGAAGSASPSPGKADY